MARLSVAGFKEEPLKRCGGFIRYDDALQLTFPNSAKPSRWRLPEWFYPGKKRRSLSYHTDRERWRKRNGHALLNMVARGQESVLDGLDYPEATTWLKKILSILSA
jgi:Nucleotide modification associated domain 3